MNSKYNKITKYCITLLFLLLPVLDVLRVTKIKDIEFLNIAVIELVNIILIIIPFFITLFKHKFTIKLNKYKYLYLLLMIIYIILHVVNIFNFNINIYPFAKFNFIVEIYYIFRVYILPLLLIYILTNNRDIFNKKYYLSIIKYLIIAISGSIVLLNLLGCSYSTYVGTYRGYVVNSSNFFNVFNYQEDYRDLLTCGLFSSPNQISIILVMLLPFNIYNMYYKKNKSSILLVLLQIFSMIIIGTKVAVLGSMIIIIGTMFMYLFFYFLYKKRNRKYFTYHIITIIISILIFSISPFFKMKIEELKDDSEFSKDIEIYNGLNKLDSDIEIIDYINKYHNEFKIDSLFLEMYPVELDPKFWLEMAKRDNKLNNNYRIIKQDIIGRIASRNNNNMDKLFGLGYTLDFPELEKDYVYQYYLFGFFGLALFVLIYILIYIFNISKVLNKTKFNYNYTLPLVSTFFGLILCYFSGHLFGWVTPMFVLALSLCIERSVINDD